MTITLVIAEDNTLLREGMRGLFAAEDGLDLLAAVGDLPTLIEAVDSLRPQVVLTDIRMPPSRTDEGLQAAEHCRVTHPDTAVVLLSQYADPGYVRALLTHGTERRGYLLKERVADVDDLVQAVRTVAEGGSVVDPKVVETLVSARRRSAGPQLGRLTPRELEVLQAMAQGHNNARIAADLVVTQRAVEKHINSIFAKLDVTAEGDEHPRVRAVLHYLSAGQS